MAKAVFQVDLAESFPHLAKAPIVEAVIHWQAKPERAFNEVDLRAELLARLPEYPEVKPQHEVRLEAEVNVVEASTSTRARRTWQGLRLTSTDGKYIVQVRRDGIVFSRLEPYNDWKTFSSEATRVWREYCDFARPSEVERLGVRFINQIPLKSAGEIRKVLRSPPRPLASLKLPPGPFFFQSTHMVPGHPIEIELIRTVQPAVPPQAEGVRLILDTDVYTTQAMEIDDELLSGRLAVMRWLKDKVFFNLLTDRAIKTFQGRES